MITKKTAKNLRMGRLRKPCSRLPMQEQEGNPTIRGANSHSNKITTQIAKLQARRKDRDVRLLIYPHQSQHEQFLGMKDSRHQMASMALVPTRETRLLVVIAMRDLCKTVMVEITASLKWLVIMNILRFHVSLRFLGL